MSNSTQYILFIGDDKKYTFFGMTFSFKGHNDELPELLSKSICTRRRNPYSLRGKDSLVVPRFETRYMKDSLTHRGSVLWNLVSFKEHDIWYLSKKDLYQRIRTRDYVTTVFVDTRLWKTKHPRKRVQNFRQSYVLSTYRIEIHQS